MDNDLEMGQHGRPVAHLEQLGDAELYFEDTGPPDAPAILYLHGGPGYNAFSFRELAGEALERYRVVYLDGRGSGRSTELPQDSRHYTIDAMVDDIEAVRDFLGIARLTPLGHGFGAVLALEYARRFPQRAERAILVNPWIHYPELSRTLVRAAASLSGKPLDEVADESQARVEQAFAMLNARDLLAALHFPTANSRMRLEFSDAEGGLLGGGLVQEGLVVNGLWDFEYPPYLPDLSRSIFVLAGIRDATSYPEQTDWLVDLADAEITELDAGHYPWVDDPDGFAAAIHEIVPLPPLS